MPFFAIHARILDCFILHSPVRFRGEIFTSRLFANAPFQLLPASQFSSRSLDCLNDPCDEDCSEEPLFPQDATPWLSLRTRCTVSYVSFSLVARRWRLQLRGKELSNSFALHPSFVNWGRCLEPIRFLPDMRSDGAELALEIAPPQHPPRSPSADLGQ